MALIVEDGSGLPTANSYLTVEMADAYFADVNNEAWNDASDDEKASALIRATRDLNTKYQGRWPGQKAVSGQALAWPRSLVQGQPTPLPDPEGGVIPINFVPVPVKNATAEIAVINLTGNFLPQTLSADNAIKSEKVDVIETVYKDGAPMVTTYPYIDAMLTGYINGTPGSAIWGAHVSLTPREIAGNAELESAYLQDPRYFIQA